MATTKRLAILAVVAIGLVGCADEPRRYSLIGFDADEISAIQDAAAERCAAGADCPLVSGGDNRIELHERLTDGGNGVDASGYIVQTRDLTPDGSTRILVLDRRSHLMWLEFLRRTMLHEFGHAVGCRDVAEPGYIMSVNEGDEPWHLTQADIDCAR